MTHLIGKHLFYKWAFFLPESLLTWRFPGVGSFWLSKSIMEFPRVSSSVWYSCWSGLSQDPELYMLGKCSTPEHTDPHPSTCSHVGDQQTVCLTESSDPRADVLPCGIACPGSWRSGKWLGTLCSSDGRKEALLSLPVSVPISRHPSLTPSRNHFSSTWIRGRLFVIRKHCLSWKIMMVTYSFKEKNIWHFHWDTDLYDEKKSSKFLCSQFWGKFN